VPSDLSATKQADKHGKKGTNQIVWGPETLFSLEVILTVPDLPELEQNHINPVNPVW
jgi:hypothetical protein